MAVVFKIFSQPKTFLIVASLNLESMVEKVLDILFKSSGARTNQEELK